MNNNNSNSRTHEWPLTPKTNVTTSTIATKTSIRAGSMNHSHPLKTKTNLTTLTTTTTATTTATPIVG